MDKKPIKLDELCPFCEYYDSDAVCIAANGQCELCPIQGIGKHCYCVLAAERAAQEGIEYCSKFKLRKEKI